MTRQALTLPGGCLHEVRAIKLHVSHAAFEYDARGCICGIGDIASSAVATDSRTTVTMQLKQPQAETGAKVSNRTRLFVL